jgi:6-phosphogluconate dehydrogenase
MNVGVIGLAGDGLDTAIRLKRSGEDIIVYDRNAAGLKEASELGITTSPYIEELAFNMESKRILWMFSPDETAMDDMLSTLIPHLSVSDIIIAGNPPEYENTVRRCREAQGFQIDLLDCSFQKSSQGKELSAYVGGNRFAFNYCEQMFQRLAAAGLFYCGLSGSGILKKKGTSR